MVTAPVLPARLRRRDVIALSSAYLLFAQILVSALLFTSVEAIAASQNSFATAQLCSGATLSPDQDRNAPDPAGIVVPHCPLCIVNSAHSSAVLPTTLSVSIPQEILVARPNLSAVVGNAWRSPLNLCARAPPVFS